MASKLAHSSSHIISSSTSSSDWEYDVFLSFRGEDTRNNFVGHLYKELDTKGIYTFKDDLMLEKGKSIAQALPRVIKKSRFAVVVISEDYASSSWCLDELVRIMECRETKGQTVIPIFYNVDPADVRKQRGKFQLQEGKFEKKLHKVDRWRKALTDVATISGWHSRHRDEAKLIEEIVGDISDKLVCKSSSDARDLVGIGSQVKGMDLRLEDLNSEAVQMIGTWGMGGVEEVTRDSKACKIVVKGKTADPKQEEIEEPKEEKKEEESKVEEKKEETKEEKKQGEKKEEEPPEIVLKVDMHCEACARTVAKALKGFEGVEEVITDSKASKVVVKGKKADPVKVCERLQKEIGRKVEINSPLPKPPEEYKQEESKEPEEEKKEEPPAVVTVVLSIRMHCEGCAQQLQRGIGKIQGVESVETDLANAKVIVKGVVDPAKLVEVVYKKTRKQASIVKEEEKKEEEKKEEKKEAEKEEEKKEAEKGGEEEETRITGVKSVETDLANAKVMVKGVVDPAKLVEDVYKKTTKQASIVKEEEKMEEEKKEEEKKEEKEEEEKKEAEKGGGEEERRITDVKGIEYWPSRCSMEYYFSYPQIFSDENPNACSIM